MKITIVQGAFLPVPPLRGGAIEKAWHALGAEFATRGHEVVHVSRLCDGLPARSEEGGVRHVRIHGFDTPSRLWWLKTLDLIYSLRAVARLPKADVLVTHTFFLPILARLRRHAGRVYVHVGRTPRGQMRLYRHASVLQVPSSPVASAVRAELAQVRGVVPRVEVVGYPVVLPPVGGPVRRDAQRILYAGRVHPEKGLALLVEAFAAFARRAGPGWTLRVVGPWQVELGGGGGEHLRSLQSLAKGAGARVEFAGPVFEPQALAREYATASIFAYPSLAEQGETFGLAALEAMASGLPAVVSRLGCFADFVREGENGAVFEHAGSGAAAACAEALWRTACRLQSDEARVRSAALGTAAAYSVPAIAEAHLALMQQSCRGSASTEP